MRETTEAAAGELLSQMSADIKLLGGWLGRIIREQHGDDAFDLV